MNEDMGRILFIFAKEFGWGYEYVMSLPYKIFKMYVHEMSEYVKEQEAASKGKKHKRNRKPLTDEEKAKRRKVIEEMSNEHTSD